MYLNVHTIAVSQNIIKQLKIWLAQMRLVWSEMTSVHWDGDTFILLRKIVLLFQTVYGFPSQEDGLKCARHNDVIDYKW